MRLGERLLVVDFGLGGETVWDRMDGTGWKKGATYRLQIQTCG